MTARQADLGASVAAVICAGIACTAPWIPVRAAATVPLCLVLPGLALTRAIFARSPKKAQPTRAMRFTLVPALSLATLIIGAVLLDLAPGGIQRTSWALLLVAVTVLASVVRNRRGGRNTGVTVSLRLPHARLGSIVTLTLASVIAVTAFVASRRTLSARNAIGYTQLWILPARNGQHAVNIGVASDQLRATGYRLVVSHGKKRHSWRMTLPPGHARHLTVSIAGPKHGYVTATLYRDGHAGPYRQVRLAASRA